MKSYNELCEKRSKIHQKIKKIIIERLLIAYDCKSTLSVSEQSSKLYADLEILFAKDSDLWWEHKIKSILLRKGERR